MLSVPELFEEIIFADLDGYFCPQISFACSLIDKVESKENGWSLFKRLLKAHDTLSLSVKS